MRRIRNDSPPSSSGCARHPDRPRTARFVCALTVMDAERIVFETTGTVEGVIAAAPAGGRGFGYDPIFYYPPYGATLAEVGEAESSPSLTAARLFVPWPMDSQGKQ